MFEYTIRVVSNIHREPISKWENPITQLRKRQIYKRIYQSGNRVIG